MSCSEGSLQDVDVELCGRVVGVQTIVFDVGTNATQGHDGTL